MDASSITLEKWRHPIREFLFPGAGIKSFSTILRRIADPVDPFNFICVQNDLQPPLRDGMGDRLGKPLGLFDQSNQAQPNELQQLHWDFWLPAGRRSRLR